MGEGRAEECGLTLVTLASPKKDLKLGPPPRNPPLLDIVATPNHAEDGTKVNCDFYGIVESVEVTTKIAAKISSCHSQREYH
jgi:hypothetical protein